MFSETISFLIKFILVIVSLFMVCCVSISQKSGYQDDIEGRIVPRKTSLSSVLELLGPPNSYSEENGFMILIYQKQEKGSQNRLLPMPTTKDILESAITTTETSLVIEIDSQSKIVSSVERRVTN